MVGAYVGQGGYANNWEMRKRSVTLAELLAEERLKQITAFLALSDPVMLQCSQVPRLVLEFYIVGKKSPRTDTAKTCKFWQQTI